MREELQRLRDDYRAVQADAEKGSEALQSIAIASALGLLAITAALTITGKAQEFLETVQGL